MRHLAAIFAVVCLSSSAFAQTRINNNQLPTNITVRGNLVLTPRTVSQLPAASAANGGLAAVTDGTSSSDCTAGGGSTVVFCSSNGTAWSAMGSGIVKPFSGPSPWTDVTAYGARAIASFGTTGTINATSTSLTLGAASNFINGDGIAIIGAGATTPLANPSAPTVTPSVPLSGIGTDLTAAGPSGGGSATYYVVADDGNGGLSAVSSAGTTSTQQTLGIRTLTGCSLSRVSSATSTPAAVTVSSCTPVSGSSIAELATGEQIQVSLASDDNFNGVFNVTGVTGSTSFTYGQGWNATASTTGATITYYNLNHISVGSPASNVWEYHFYKSVAGTPTYICSTLPWPQAFASHYAGAAGCDDYGTTFTPVDGTVLPPWWVPATNPAASKQNDFLVTTITAGAGTTTVTLALAATNSVSGAAVRFDNTPAFNAALANVSGLGADSVILIPQSSNGVGFVFNSPVKVPSYLQTVQQDGSIVLNAPLIWDSAGTGNTANWFGRWKANGNWSASFALNTTTTVLCSVSPCSYTYYSGNNAAINMEGIGITARKNGIAFSADCPATFDIEHNYFSNSGELGAPFVFRFPAGCGGATARPYFAHNLISPDSSGTATTAAGFLMFGGDQYLKMFRNMINGRGMVFNTIDAQGFALESEELFTQNQIYAPLVLVAGAANSCLATLQHVTEDTSGAPEIAFIAGNTFGVSGFCNGTVNIKDTIGSVGFHYTSGGGIADLQITGANTCSISTCTILGQNQNVTVNGVGVSQPDGTLSASGSSQATSQLVGTRAIIQSGPLPRPIAFDQPASTPTATLTGGGSLAANTAYTYKIIGIFPDKGTTAPGSASNSVTTPGTCPGSGNCSVANTWAAIPGAVAYTLINVTQGFEVGGCSNITGLSCTDTGASFFNASFPTVASSGFPAVSSTGINSPLVIVKSTGTTVTMGLAGVVAYYLNQEGTAGTGVTYTLPPITVGMRQCVENSGTTGVTNTGVLTVYPQSGNFVIYKGVVNTVGGGGTHGIASGGAVGDSACFLAIDSTHWEVTSYLGTWTEN